MMFSSRFGKRTRVLLVCLLSLFVLASLSLAVGAVQNEQTLLTLDPNTMDSLTGSTDAFSWKAGGGYGIIQADTNTYRDKVIRISKGNFAITDTKKTLADHKVVSVSADLYFDALPSGIYSSTVSCDPNTDLEFQSQSVVTWYGMVGEAGYFDGIRIDSEGNLYYGTTLGTAIGYKLAEKTWYNLQIIHSALSNNSEIWVNGERVAVVNCRFRDTSEYVRFFDGKFSYNAYVKNIKISASDTPYYCGIVKENTSDFLSYQTTKPAADGSFKLRIIAGVDSLKYKSFGYRVLILTKDASGNTVTRELEGIDNAAYSSFFGGSTRYGVKDTFGYEYACLATLENLNKNSKFTEIIIFPYTVSNTEAKVYGAPISLAYTGATDRDGYPLFSKNNTHHADVLPTDDTSIYNGTGYADTVYGAETSLMVRNTGGVEALLYRAVYLKFTIPKETVDRLATMANIFLRVNVKNYEKDTSRDIRPLVLFAASTGWDEDTLTYATRANAVRGEEIARIDGEECSGYISYDVLDYIKKQTPSADGSITVAFCLTQPDGHPNTRMLYIYAKESGNAPYLRFEETLYGHSLLTVKTANEGYEPLAYAEKLVDNWFDVLYPKLYLDENGNRNYHDELGDFDPNGYAAIEATGDYTDKIMWKNGLPWYSAPTENKISNIVLHKDAWDNEKYLPRFARTLSTLGTSTSNAYLSSAYAKKQTEYDAFGGITNMGFTGKVTNYFHTEKHTDGRTYIIDPLGNPYFAASVNTVVYGTADTKNQQNYILDAYETPENFFTEISASLRDLGVNTAFVSSSDSLLAVKENGLAVTVSAYGIGDYMAKLGRSQVSEGVFPNNNTINVFDPDFVSHINKKNSELITSKGYATMKNLFAYTADNELPSGLTILERYMTMDPTIPENVFSYHTAWEWFARKTGNPNPTIYDLQKLSAEDYAAYNSEFLGFIYATYYRIVGDSIRAADPNHMYIGSRVNGNCPYDEGYLRAAGEYLDIIAINLYGGLNPSKDTLSMIYRCSGKPFIVTEFFAKALDTLDGNGLPLANSTGAGILVFTQEDRAKYYEHYVLNLLETKSCVGWVWYRFRDNDQSLYTVIGKDGTVYQNVKFLSTTYGEEPHPNSLMTEDGSVYWLDFFYDGDPKNWANATTADGQKIFEKTYSGEALASNQNVNKGFYNNNFSSTVTVYTYNADGTLRIFLYEDEETTTMDLEEMLTFGSVSYEVADPESAYVADGTVLTSKDGTKTFTLGKKTNDDGTYTVTKLTTYKGRYIALTDSIKTVNDNLVGLIGYLDNN